MILGIAASCAAGSSPASPRIDPGFNQATGEIAQSGGTQTGEGMATAGLVTGIVSIVFGVISIILFATGVIDYSTTT